MNRPSHTRLVAAFLLLIGNLLVTPSLRAQDVVINEVMSSNSQALIDDLGGSADWIELANTTGSNIDLEGYGLSDDELAPRWVLPRVVIPANERLIIFASGKDRALVPSHWETVIDDGDIWRYRIPSSEPNAAWRSPGYDDSSWSSGATGIGYGDGDDRTNVPSGTVSVYARKTFQVDDVADITHVFLDLDFDDGFVAYLNGEEIARENMSGAGTPPRYNDLATTQTEPSLIGGGELYHYAETRFVTHLREGENVLAIQLHNGASSSSDLTLIPYLTLGMNTPPANPQGLSEDLRAVIPALHTDFKIDSETSETIRLTAPDGSEIDSVEVNALPTDISIGRYPDGSGVFQYHSESTPGAPNDDPGFSALSDPIEFSHEGGLHQDPITLSLSSAQGLTIHVTLDGTDPSSASPVYQNPIEIDETTVVRARIHADDVLSRATQTRTYMIGGAYSLPVLSIATTPANFFDIDTGIYVRGRTSEPNVPYYGSNFWEEWERPVHLELFEESGELGMSLDAGVKMFGGWSRAHAQKSLAFFARSQYGPGQFRHQIFPNKRLDRFESFIARNSGNDWQRAHFRDAMMTSLLEDLSVDRQAYRPAVILLNGEYWGIQNLREKVNEHFLASNNDGVRSDQIDLLEREGRAIHGDTDHFDAMIAYVQNNNVSNAAVYEEVGRRIDIENFIDYQASQIYFDNRDWPGNNIKFWRPRTPEGRWRWIMYDTDFGFSIYNATAYQGNTLAFALETNGPNWPNPPWSTLLLRRLMTNQSFVEEFSNRLATHMSTIFEPRKVIDRIDSMASHLQTEMPAQKRRWGGSMSNWQSNLSAMRNFATQRPANVRSHMRSTLRLGANSSLRISLRSPGGHVQIQGVSVRNYPYAGNYFRDLPIRLTATPDPGYRFTGWQGDLGIDQNAEISIALQTSTTSISAGFELDCDAISDVVINEINYNGPEGMDPGDWVELHNRSLNVVDIGGWVFRDRRESHTFTIPNGTSLEPGSFLVLASDVAAFSAQHPDAEVLGDIGFSFEGSGEFLQLFDEFGEEVDYLIYNDKYPWPEEADGAGATLALQNPILDNAHSGYWAASRLGGTPGQANTDIFTEVEASCIGGEVFLRGDCNDDGIVDVSDPICTLVQLFSREEPANCAAALNSNGDDAVDISDSVFTLEYLFLDGPSPGLPFPSCGSARILPDLDIGCEARPGSCL